MSRFFCIYMLVIVCTIIWALILYKFVIVRNVLLIIAMVLLINLIVQLCLLSIKKIRHRNKK